MEYDLEQIAASTEDVAKPKHTPKELAYGLAVLASQNRGSIALKRAAETAQEIVGERIDEPIDENPYSPVETLESFKKEARRCYMQSKAHKTKDLNTYKAISRLIDTVSVNGYEKVVF